MKLHTGETQYAATKGWSWPQRQQLGQRYLQQLAEAILCEWEGRKPTSGTASKVKECRAKLELDGYVFRDGTLLAPEEDVLDAEEAVGVLEQLYSDLNLADSETTLHHLHLSEEHYLAGRWDDSIGNSRKFLEGVLTAVADARSRASTGHALPQSTASRPVRVRDYLESSGLLEKKERTALDSIYGLLSATGGHPYMAASEQARLLRHLALTLGQFVMLRLQGSRSRA